MLHYVLQHHRHQHEGRVAVREGPDDPCPSPDFAVDALDPVVRPDPAPVLGREFRVGQRLGEPFAHRPRGRPAELRHTEINLPGVYDESSRVMAAAVGLPARRPLVARSALTSSDASSSSSASSNPSSTDAMFADAVRAPLPSSVICCLAAGNHMTGRGPCSAMRSSIYKRNYAPPPFDEKLINNGSAARAWG